MVRISKTTIFTLLFLLLSSACGKKDSPQGLAGFSDAVEPILASYCYDCHAGGMDEGEVDFDHFENVDQLLAARDFWEGVYVNLQSSQMPPVDESQPSDTERAFLLQWIEDKVFKLDPNHPDPGRPIISRLNRDEYNRTVRDLFGMDLNPAHSFPEDDSGYGFDNIGEVLTLSPALFEKYFQASAEIVDQVIITSAPAPQKKTYSGGEFTQRKGKSDTYSGTMASTATLGVLFTPHEEGEYQIRVSASGSQARHEWPMMRVEVENSSRKDIRVDSANPKSFELSSRLRKDRPYWIDISFINDQYDPHAKDRSQRDRNLYLSRIEVTGPLNQKIPPPTVGHQKLLQLAKAEDYSSKDRYAEAIIGKFASKAWRRSQLEDTEDSLQKLYDLYRAEKKSGHSFEESLKVALRASLISPRFLFRGEYASAEEKATKGAVLIDEFSLASRLSYFLWSSTPDDELLDLASKGELREQLSRQVTRMLRDSRIRAMTTNFAGQWLQLRNLRLVSPDKKKFPDWDDALKRDVRLETEMFFEFVLQENRPVTDFLDADYTFLNERLARHYGVDSVKGNDFQRVIFNPKQRMVRGGLLTQASVLTITSDPTRTSIVNRGNYVLENLLGTPPPPPPEDIEIPNLEDAHKNGSAPATLREQLEVHREKSICSSCHNRMDPIGFGLENYNAIGKWREKENGKPIDASGKLYTGENFAGAKELRNILADQKADLFLTCLCEKLLTYSLGRGIEYYDRPSVQKIVKRAKEGDGRFHEIILGVVESVPFQRMRVDGE